MENQNDSQECKLNIPQVAEKIEEEHILIFSADTFYEYRSGCYYAIEEMEVRKWIYRILKDDYTIHRANEIVGRFKASSHISTSAINASGDLNLRNCMLYLEERASYDHSPEYYSTVQLDVDYNPESTSPKWIKTLSEIFEDDEEKIKVLQEFFGLCLTTETKFEKCLFCVGEGANGKSLILHVLQAILGNQNCSAIPLEQFGNRHYLANLFGKLANISIETFDSTFKAIISGDSIEADNKYKQPFTFKPFSKLIFALNDLPRVEDKSHGYFRKVIILRFKRRFTEEEQNRNLKDELVEEMDGIFNWCLEGLVRLVERGYFEIGPTITHEIDEYKRENNNVIVFVEEKCEIGLSTIPVDDLYAVYAIWCKDNGHQALSKINFGKELQRQYSNISKSRSNKERVWLGIKGEWMVGE